MLNVGVVFAYRSSSSISSGTWTPCGSFGPTLNGSTHSSIIFAYRSCRLTHNSIIFVHRCGSLVFSGPAQDGNQIVHGSLKMINRAIGGLVLFLEVLKCFIRVLVLEI